MLRKRIKKQHDDLVKPVDLKSDLWLFLPDCVVDLVEF